MAKNEYTYRDTRRGIVLISTLVSLVLLIGLAMALQAAALANTKTLKRLTTEHQRGLAIDASRELLRPQFTGLLIGNASGDPKELMIDIDGLKVTYQVSLNSHRQDQLLISAPVTTALQTVD